MTNTPLPAAVCVLGMGLIGGSLMRAVQPHVPVFGWAPGIRTRAAAVGDGFDVVDELDAALERATQADALVVMAAPITAFPQLLRRIDEFAPATRLTDVASVKAPIAVEVAALAPQARYIGSHPMAGTEHSGWAAGSAELFADHVWVTTLREDSDVDLWAPIAGLAVTIGSRVVPCEAVSHDDAVARISHLPHLMAAALAQVGSMGGPLALSLAASSFRDGTRVAATRPELTRAMCETNASYVIDAMDEALAQLGVARGSLASSGSLAKLATVGFDARAEFDRRFDGLESVQLTGDDMAEQLLSVGSGGGYVTGISSTATDFVIDAMYPPED
ncbi:MAG: prephenate dehydrogenase [Nakamurella sp.]